MRRLPVWLLAMGALVALLSPGLASSAELGTSIPITSCPFVITVPGTYALAIDGCGAGILITADNVKLKLNGHAMTGSPSSLDGIAAQHVSRVQIKGPGTITNYPFGRGIAFVDVGNSVIDGVTASGNLVGIGVNGTGIIVRKNTANGSAVGIVVEGTGIIVKNNTANNNNDIGIIIADGATGNSVKHNSVHGNSTDLFDKDHSHCIGNTFKDNSFTTANDPCIR